MRRGSATWRAFAPWRGWVPGNKRDGSVAYYLSEKVVADDPKGVGAYMMATAQKIMLP